MVGGGLGDLHRERLDARPHFFEMFSVLRRRQVRRRRRRARRTRCRTRALSGLGLRLGLCQHARTRARYLERTQPRRELLVLRHLLAPNLCTVRIACTHGAHAHTVRPLLAVTSFEPRVRGRLEMG